MMETLRGVVGGICAFAASLAIASVGFAVLVIAARFVLGPVLLGILQGLGIHPGEFDFP